MELNERAAMPAMVANPAPTFAGGQEPLLHAAQILANQARALNEDT